MLTVRNTGSHFSSGHGSGAVALLCSATVILGITACTKPITGMGDSSVADIAEVAGDAVVDSGQESTAELYDAPQAADADADADSTPDLATKDLPEVALPCPPTGTVVQATDPPKGATCTEACAPGYPCTCGDCPWVQTPPMNFPRYDAGVVWTGKEVLIFGGKLTPFPSNQCCVGFTGEKWNPSKKAGFEMMNFKSLAFSGTVPDFAKFTTVWTGKEAFVRLTDDNSKGQKNWMLRYDPEADSGQWMDMTNAPPGFNGHLRFAGGKVVADARSTYGYIADPPTQRIVGLFDPVASAWEIVPWPDFFVSHDTTAMHSCMVAVGDDYFLYGVTDPIKAEYKQDPKWPSTLKLNVPTKKWSFIAQAPFVSKCYGGATITPRFGATKTGFLVWGSSWPNGKPESFTPTVGGYYDIVNDTWQIMKNPDFARPHTADVDILWNGKVFVFHDIESSIPTEPDPQVNKGLASGYVALYDFDLGVWALPSKTGVPSDKRGRQALAVSADEVFTIGGINGPDWANVVHATGIRYHLAKESLP